MALPEAGGGLAAPVVGLAGGGLPPAEAGGLRVPMEDGRPMVTAGAAADTETTHD